MPRTAIPDRAQRSLSFGAFVLILERQVILKSELAVGRNVSRCSKGTICRTCTPALLETSPRKLADALCAATLEIYQAFPSINGKNIMGAIRHPLA
jgi:hypothetical protein